MTLILLALLVLGSMLLVKEHYQGTSALHRCAELGDTISTLEARLSKAQAFADESRRFQREVFRLEAQNRDLQERNSACAERVTALEAESKRLAKELEDSWRLRALAQGPRDTSVAPPAAAQVEGPLATDVRLPNGTQVERAVGLGRGELEVRNNLKLDAVVKIVRISDNRCIAGFYVQSNGNWTHFGIPDGRYSVYFATGYDYDAVRKTFRRQRLAKKCDSIFDFATRSVSANTWSATSQQLTLGSVLGNLGASQMSGDEFDQLGPQ